MEKENSLMLMLPQSIRDGMNRFDEIYYSSLESISPTLTRAVEILKKGEGKHIRPILLLLVGGSFAPITDRLINGGVFIEMFHLSTLIHDDIVDESNIRRGQPSMNAVFGNHKAVLIGDYVLATSMIQAMLTDNKEVINHLVHLGQYLSEGEIFQMDLAELGNYSEDDYFKVIQRKTSSLLKACMQIGASLSGVESREIKEQIGLAGDYLGTAFQIRDDIFDFIPTKHLGKPAGQDIREHKVTLPLIYALKQDNKEAEKVKKILRHRDLNDDEVRYIIDFVIRMKGIDYATKVMQQLIDDAKLILQDTIPEGENKEALMNIADYIGNRNR